MQWVCWAKKKSENLQRNVQKICSKISNNKEQNCVTKKAHKFQLDNNNSVTPSLPYLLFCPSGYSIVYLPFKKEWEKKSINILLPHNINKEALKLL